MQVLIQKNAFEHIISKMGDILIPQHKNWN